MVDDWQLIPLADLASICRGVSWRKNEESQNGEGVAVLSIPNVGRGRLDFNAKHRLKKVPNASKLLAVGDVLFVGSSGSIDNIARNARVTTLPAEPVACASFTFKATPRRAVCDPAFFYFLMNSPLPAFADFARRAADGKFNFQLTSFVQRSSFRIPPLAEQRQIAAVLSAVQRAIERQERLIALTAELKKALMHKLFTEGTRGEPLKQTEIGEVPESWAVAPLEQFTQSFQYGTSVKCAYDVKGPPVLRIPNVVGGHLDVNDLKFGNPKKNELETCRLQSGDLMFVRTNGVRENAGRCSMYRGELGETCYFASYLIRVRLHDGLMPTFLEEYTRTEIGVRLLAGRAARTADGKFNINTGTLETLLVPKPDMDEQKLIADALASMDRKARSHTASKATLEALFRTLLHQLMTAQVHVHDLDLLRGIRAQIEYTQN